MSAGLTLVVLFLASGLAYGQQAPKLKLGSLDLSVGWRTRTEVWDWFEGASGNSNYTFWHSMLRVGVGQSRQRLDWYVEAEQPAILGLPADAVVAAPQGQLGLGGTYFTANTQHTNNVGAFLKQAFVHIKQLGPASVRLGRFELFDGMEVRPKDATLAVVVQSRVAHRLISNFSFSAVQRTFDGAEVALTSGPNNLTLFAARPTAGVFQVDGMDDLHVEAYYGAYTRSVTTPGGTGALRLFVLGYVDDRTTVVKTDNRPLPARAADSAKIKIVTYGASYAHVFSTKSGGQFDAVLWGALQGGAWGVLSHRAAAYVAEVGWQPHLTTVNPWLSVGYSYGSGDGNPNDTRHGTFFQVLTTPRQYARTPFYNMMNNRDAYATLNLRPSAKLALRSEVHALSLVRASDLWYLGGGAFQPGSFGYTGRPSGGQTRLANVWDLSADCAVSRSVALTLYYGHVWGKGVITSIYPRDTAAQLLYLETLVHF
ncbi:MAG TPA: alginate export family protein [Gemmatimonadales bacterium]|nr:alginate export family protein [Gemmatimonadales bacterium]